MRSYWRVWAKSIGEKAGKTDRESDLIALIRTGIVVLMVITNVIIVLGVWRHW